MPTTPKHFELIERYFKGEIDEDERELFLKKYLEDGVFRADADSYKLISNVFKNLSPENEDRINHFLKDENSKSIRFLNFNRKLLLAAASVAIIISVSLYFYLSDRSSITPFANEYRKLNIPLYQNDNLGFAEKNKKVNSWVPVLILPQDNKTIYYQYIDTLVLKMNLPKKGKLNMSIIKESNLYILRIDSIHYIIKQGIIKFRELEVVKD